MYYPPFAVNFIVQSRAEQKIERPPKKGVFSRPSRRVASDSPRLFISSCAVQSFRGLDPHQHTTSLFNGLAQPFDEMQVSSRVILHTVAIYRVG